MEFAIFYEVCNRVNPPRGKMTSDYILIFHPILHIHWMNISSNQHATCLVRAYKQTVLNTNPRILNFNPYISSTNKHCSIFYTYNVRHL